eukprot:g12877.t1
MRPPFDRLRFCISILFAQTTFRLSIDSKLPIVSYATAFDHFAMACQLLLLSIILGDVIVVMLADRWFGFGGEEVAQTVDLIVICTLLPAWSRREIIAILSFSLWVSRQRKKNASVLHLNQSGESHEKEEKNLEDFSPEAIDQVGRLRGRLRYTSARRLSPTEEKLSSDAVAVSTYLWFIHDIDPIQAQYECKFTSYIEWICPNAVRLPAPTSELQEVLAELGVEDAEDMARHPDLGNLKVLRTLALQQNELSGEIPVELSQLRLFQLSLAKNKLIGHIPKELGQISCLAELWLSQNQLSGEIPKELGDLANLTTLLLDRNQLTGPIPMQLSQLQALDWFNLDSNQLTGEIPRELGQLKAMRALTLRRNQLSGEIPKELGELPALTTLDLAMNQLKGPIPAELAQLKGRLPKELGQLEQLQELFLAENQLSGELPKELGELKHLRTLVLYENQLSGRIPKELAQSEAPGA